MSVKILLYCTKAKPYLVYDYYDNSCGKCITADKIESYHLNGKIVAECECEKVEEIICSKIFNGVGFDVIYDTCELLENKLYKKSCLDYYHFGDYFGEKDNEPVGYALYLSNVKVFDEPKELAKHTLDNNSDYYVKKWIKKFDSFKGSALTKAPQNMCNVYDKNCNHYILISIRPEHLCKILNGEKTIEVRKKILNSLREML